MATLTFNGSTYTVDHATKGTDYIHGYDANGNAVVSIEGIKDFSSVEYDGEYLDPTSCANEECNTVLLCGGVMQTRDGRPAPGPVLEEYYWETESHLEQAIINACATMAVNSSKQILLRLGSNTFTSFNYAIATIHYTDYGLVSALIDGGQFLYFKRGSIKVVDGALSGAWYGLEQIVTCKGSRRQRLADFVVEQGTTDDWTWQKWYSGKFEAWCHYTGNTTPELDNPNVYQYVFDLPFEVQGVPNIFVTLCTTSYDTSLISVSDLRGGTFGSFNVRSASLASLTINANIHMIGTYAQE